MQNFIKPLKNNPEIPKKDKVSFITKIKSAFKSIKQFGTLLNTPHNRFNLKFFLTPLIGWLIFSSLGLLQLGLLSVIALPALFIFTAKVKYSEKDKCKTAIVNGHPVEDTINGKNATIRLLVAFILVMITGIDKLILIPYLPLEGLLFLTLVFTPAAILLIKTNTPASIMFRINPYAPKVKIDSSTQPNKKRGCGNPYDYNDTRAPMILRQKIQKRHHPYNN